MAIGSEIRSQIRSLLTNGSEFGAWLRNSEPGGGSGDYCGLCLNKHNLKAHTTNAHPGMPTKEILLSGVH